MRLLAVVIFVLLMGLPAAAEPSGAGPQVAVAKSDAIESLKRQIITSHINPNLTVADLIEKVGGGPELDRVLGSAEELGDPRWLGEQAVQVRLSIDGSRIAKLLLRLVQSHPKQSPISVETLQRQLKWWSDRIFSATGTSMGAGDIGRLRPTITDRTWWEVGDADRRRALIAARDNAIDRVFQSLGSIDLARGKTLGQALADPAVHRSLKQWMEKQPVKGVEFNDDLTVRVTLADLASGLWPILKTALTDQHAVPVPASNAEWDHVREQVTEHLANAVGIGMVQSPGRSGGSRPAVMLPAEPPPWSKEQAEAEATSPQEGSPLHTSRRAEALAMEKLRDQVNQLPLAPGMTVGDAAGKDPHIEEAIAKCLNRARPSRVDYAAKGAVTVHVVFRLADLWSALSGQE